MKFNPSRLDSKSINICKVTNTRHNYFVFLPSYKIVLKPSFVLCFITSKTCCFFPEIVFKDITMKTIINRQPQTFRLTKPTSLLHNNALIYSYQYSWLHSHIIVILYIINHIIYHLPAIEVKSRVIKRHFISGPFLLSSWSWVSKSGFDKHGAVGVTGVCVAWLHVSLSDVAVSVLV